MRNYKMPKCKFCGTRFSIGAHFCKECGSKIEMPLLKTYHAKFTADMLFSSVFKIHSHQERSELFSAGLSKEDVVEDIELGNMKPWFYSRVFLFLAAVFAICEISLYSFYNDKIIPGTMIIGSLIMPFSVLVLFFELNLHKNISFYNVIFYFFLGGVISLLFTSVLYEIFQIGNTLNFWTASMVSIVEEIGKAIPIILLLNHQKKKRILNGLVIGGAIGCGFAVLESAGYAFNGYMNVHDKIFNTNTAYNSMSFFEALRNSSNDMNATILIRAILAFGGHVAWAAITGAAYAREGAINRKFLKYFFVPFILHALWDWDWLRNVLPIISYYLLSIASWCVIIHLINDAFVPKPESTEVQNQTLLSRFQITTRKKRLFFKCFVCFALLTCVFFFSWCYEIDRANKNQNLFTKFESVLETSLSNPPVFVAIEKVYNDADDSTNLEHSKITCLCFDASIYKNDGISDLGTLFVKYTNPDGTLICNNSSPQGYTYCIPISNKAKIPHGWGSRWTGVYFNQSGYYTIEIYYRDKADNKDKIVGIKRVYIK